MADTKASIEINIKAVDGSLRQNAPSGSFSPANKSPSDPWSPSAPMGVSSLPSSSQNQNLSFYDNEDTLKNKVAFDIAARKRNEYDKQLYHEELMRQDPEYAKAQDDKNISGNIRHAYRAMAVGYSTGHPEISQIAGGFIGGGELASAFGMAPVVGQIAGAAVAAANVIGEKIGKSLDQGFGNVQQVFAFNGMDTIHSGTNQLINAGVGQIPLLGDAIRSVNEGFFKLIDTLDQTAQRLSMYDGALAGAMANIEVRRLLRDVERARTLGPQLANYVEARENLAERIEDMLIRFGPPIISVLTTILKAIEIPATIISSIFDLLSNVFEAAVNANIPMVSNLLNNLQQALNQFLGNQAGNNNVDLLNDIISNAGANLPVNNPQISPVLAPGGGFNQVNPNVPGVGNIP